MIFKQTYEWVLSRRKTQTRRMVKPEDEAQYAPDGSIRAVLHKGRSKWRVGGSYAVQPGRGIPQVGRIRITGIRRGVALPVSEADAQAEGSASSADFADLWHEIYGHKRDNAPVWILSFVLDEAPSSPSG